MDRAILRVRLVRDDIKRRLLWFLRGAFVFIESHERVSTDIAEGHPVTMFVLRLVATPQSCLCWYIPLTLYIVFSSLCSPPLLTLRLKGSRTDDI